jgi:hypothetical protein
MEFYAVMKKNEILSLASKWMEQRTSFWVRLAWPKRPKIVCSPSYVDFRARVNTTRGQVSDHRIKRVHIREVWG